MICEKCKYFEHVEHNVYYCHVIDTFLEMDAAIIHCHDFKPIESEVSDGKK